MTCRNQQRSEVGRISAFAGIFCAVIVVFLFLTNHTAQSQPGVDSVDLTQKEQVLLKRAVDQSIENLRRYFALKEYDKVLEECTNLERLDPGNSIAVYYRSIAKMAQTREPFAVDLGKPGIEARLTTPTRLTAFPRVAPPPSLATTVAPPEPAQVAVAPEVTAPIRSSEEPPQVQAQHGELGEPQQAKPAMRERIRDLLAQPSARYVIIGVGILITFLIVLQILRSRKKTRLAIEAARAAAASRAAAPSGDLVSAPLPDQEGTEEEKKPPSPVPEEVASVGLFTDMPGVTDIMDQEQAKGAGAATTEDTVSPVPEGGVGAVSDETERELLVSAIEGIPTGSESVEQESVGEVTLEAKEESAEQPSALFSEEDISPESEKAEVGAPEKNDQVRPGSTVPVEEEEDLGQPEGSMRLDEFLFEESGKPSVPSGVPPVPKPGDLSVDEWRRKAHDEDFEKMMFTPGAEDATSIGKRISEDDTLVAPAEKGKPSRVEESPKKPAAAEPESEKSQEKTPQREPEPPRAEDQDTKILPERETKISRPSDDLSTVKKPLEPILDAGKQTPTSGDENAESKAPSPPVSKEEVEITDDLMVSPEEPVEASEPGKGSYAKQPEVFGKLDIESLQEVEPEEGEKQARGASSKIMKERSEALFQDQYRKACDAFAQKDWAKAIHYFSVALALQPNDQRVKENLRIARENRRKQESKK